MDDRKCKNVFPGMAHTKAKSKVSACISIHIKVYEMRWLEITCEAALSL